MNNFWKKNKINKLQSVSKYALTIINNMAHYIRVKKIRAIR